MRWLKQLFIFMLFFIGIVSSHRVSALAFSPYVSSSSDINTKWNDKLGDRTYDYDTGYNLTYDIYETKYSASDNGYDIVTKDFGKGSQQYIYFSGWAAELGYHDQNSSNSATYIVAKNNATGASKVYLTEEINLSATNDVNWDFGDGNFHHCSTDTFNARSDTCNMYYDSVGFHAYLPIEDLFPDGKTSEQWTIYIARDVNVDASHRNILYSPLIVPMDDTVMNILDGDLTISSGVNATTLISNGTQVIRRSSASSVNNDNALVPRYFKPGKSYKKNGTSESGTTVWYRVYDSYNDENAWATSAFWDFGGDPLVLSYAPTYHWTEDDCGVPTPPVTPTYEKQPDFPSSTLAHWKKYNKSNKLVDEGDYTCPVTVIIVIDRKNVDGYMKYKATAEHPKDSSHNSSAYGESLWVSKVDVYFNNKDGDKWDAGDASYPQDPSSYTYEDEAPSTPSCLKWYGPSYVKETNCYNQLVDVGYSNTTQYIQQCYKYEDAYTNKDDASCTRSYKTSKVEFQKNGVDFFVDDVYTGIPANFYCEAYYYKKDGSGTSFARYDISNYDDVWSSDKVSGTPYTPGENFIGNDRYVYKDRRGVQYANGMTSPHIINLNTFYSSDANSGKYKITCNYVPEHYKDYKFAISGKDSQSSGVSVSKNTNLNGIDKMRVSVQGCFFDPAKPGDYKCYSTDQLPNGNFTALGASRDTFEQFDFITGHWYDWKTEIIYTDGTDGTGSNGWRDITTAPEMYWQANPWYKTTAENWFTHMAKNATCYGCSNFNGTDGIDHRVPVNEWNLVIAHYFDECDTDDGRTHQEDMYWAHDIQKFKIRGSSNTSSYTSLPIDGMTTSDPTNARNEDPFYDALTDNTTLVYPNNSVDYTAWVIWTDDSIGKYGLANPFNRGQKENWTKAVTWYGDDLVSAQPPTSNKMTYTFKRRGNSDYRTLAVNYYDFTSGPSGWGQDAASHGLKNWEHLTDTLTVKISDVCDGNYLINNGCPTPPKPTYDCMESWHLYFEANANYLPPACSVGLTAWDPKNNPYRFSIDFYVTGISDGTGSK